MTKEQQLKTESVKLVKAVARDLRIAPRKIRLVANLVKGMNVNSAMVQLQHMHQKAAPMVARLIKSAIANAKNNFSLDADKLFVHSITADMGKSMKRYFPRARGSAFVIRRKLSHLNVVLVEKGSAKGNKVKLDLFKKKAEHKDLHNIDKEEAVNTPVPKVLGKKSEVFKTEQQVKLNQAQNKRRLFNRKSGE
jgi:large subunit ribosomal protein L22